MIPLDKKDWELTDKMDLEDIEKLGFRRVGMFGQHEMFAKGDVRYMTRRGKSGKYYVRHAYRITQIDYHDAMSEGDTGE